MLVNCDALKLLTVSSPGWRWRSTPMLHRESVRAQRCWHHRYMPCVDGASRQTYALNKMLFSYSAHCKSSHGVTVVKAQVFPFSFHWRETHLHDCHRTVLRNSHSESCPGPNLEPLVEEVWNEAKMWTFQTHFQMTLILLVWRLLPRTIPWDSHPADTHHMW